MGSKALVTGGAGFIGSHLIEDLSAQGHEVVCLDDLSGGYRDNVVLPAEFVHGSVCDVDLVNELFARQRFDYVFHLAAYAAEGLSHFIRRFNYNTNLIGSVNLINASVLHEVKCFVFTSSIAVYGANQVPMTEDLMPSPEDPYGISKLAVELDLRAAHHMFGLNSIIFRPHNVYGERQNIADRYRNVVGIFRRVPSPTSRMSRR
jgi:UDP-glucose 4-epimerase